MLRILYVLEYAVCQAALYPFEASKLPGYAIKNLAILRTCETVCYVLVSFDSINLMLITTLLYIAHETAISAYTYSSAQAENIKADVCTTLIIAAVTVVLKLCQIQFVSLSLS